MKATGIIRRIDDLGRVVIPREIRRALRIHEGDPLEIYTDPREGTVIFKKYSYAETDFKPYITALLNTLRTKGVVCGVYDVDGYLFEGNGVPKQIDVDDLGANTFDLNYMGERIGVLYVEHTEAEGGIILHALTMFKELVKAHEISY